MKTQLSNDKAIGSKAPAAGRAGRAKSDIVGVELFSGCERGCPAVRLKRKKDGWTLEAADYVPAPKGDMPDKWDDITHQPTWSMPNEFQANSAAIAVNSPLGSFGQASPEAIVQEMMHGLPSSGEKLSSYSSVASADKRKFSVKREGGASGQQTVSSGKRPELPSDNGVPVSENGRRFVLRPFADDGFKLYASLPEFQALWLSRLLPEGHRPTASSIQLAESALMASVLAQPAFAESKGNALVVYVRQKVIYFGGYKDGESILWRKCPGVRGYSAVQQAMMKTLGLTKDLVDSALEDTLFDTRTALEPVMHPVLEQLELARAYLSSKHGIDVEKTILLGMPHGAEHWRQYAEESLKLDIVAPDPLGGVTPGKGVSVKEPCDFLVALGAALAASEAEI